MLHGRLVGGLAARSLEQHLAGSGLQITRLTVDLFRPAGMTPVEIRIEPVRRGRRICVVDAIVSSDGHDIARVTALAMQPSEAPPGDIWQPEATEWPKPDGTNAISDEDKPDDGWMFIPVEGGFASGERTRVWTNETRSLVNDEPLTPVVRAALSGDVACPLANSGTDGLHYINADYTLVFGRQPVGVWIGLEVNQHIAASGLALASCTLVDTSGPFATSTGASLTRPKL